MASLYTVFDANDGQRTNWLGPILCRTLASVRQHAQPGDTIQRFGNAGQPSGSWEVCEGGKLLKRQGRR